MGLMARQDFLAGEIEQAVAHGTHVLGQFPGDGGQRNTSVTTVWSLLGVIVGTVPAGCQCRETGQTAIRDLHCPLAAGPGRYDMMVSSSPNPLRTDCP